MALQIGDYGSLCVMGGSDGDVAVWNGTAWSSDQRIDPASASDVWASCPTAEFCMAVDQLAIDQGGDAMAGHLAP